MSADLAISFPYVCSVSTHLETLTSLDAGSLGVWALEQSPYNKEVMLSTPPSVHRKESAQEEQLPTGPSPQLCERRSWADLVPSLIHTTRRSVRPRPRIQCFPVQSKHCGETVECRLMSRNKNNITSLNHRKNNQKSKCVPITTNTCGVLKKYIHTKHFGLMWVASL